MSYSKNTWANGDTITAAKLNNMESGIEAASGTGDSPIFPLYLTLNETTNRLESTLTWGELHSAILAKKIILAVAVSQEDDENIGLIGLDSVNFASVVNNNKWSIRGGFVMVNQTINVSGSEDNADVPISIPISVG